jgi:hypothetical protein
MLKLTDKGIAKFSPLNILTHQQKDTLLAIYVCTVHDKSSTDFLPFNFDKRTIDSLKEKGLIKEV